MKKHPEMSFDVSQYGAVSLLPFAGVLPPLGSPLNGFAFRSL
jgi:hypothetical protein